MSTASLANLSFRLNRVGGYSNILPGVILLTDTERLPDPLPAAAALPPGSAVILRHYDDPGRETLGRDLLALCRQRGLKLLVAGDWRLAWKLGAHGVHLPEWQLRRPPPRRRTANWLITAAAHSPKALIQAARLGADAALLSPVFATASHPGASGIGLQQFARAVRRAPIPVYGLGGIHEGNAHRLKHCGIAGIAAISGLADEASD
jgi:thiamine-phosphate pyrophosphorylase